jgi:pSer/pThr/pTyr-binding forkhead associated (FHA) protein
LFVSDQSSRNGTFVNGVPIQDKYKLNSRDILGLGRAEYRLIFEGDD